MSRALAFSFASASLASSSGVGPTAAPFSAAWAAGAAAGSAGTTGATDGRGGTEGSANAIPGLAGLGAGSANEMPVGAGAEGAACCDISWKV